MTTETLNEFATEPLIERLRRATIGRYDVYAELGSGGMATVFLALDLALDRKVAIKVMSPALASSPDAIERFRREARVAAALSHPNIIGIYAVGDDPTLAFYVMKFVEGRALDSVIKDEGPQSITFVQAILQYAGTALDYAHARGVVHRDVKPANFMLDMDGWLVMTDFGIAKMEEAKGLTLSGTLVGTPYYMSPEQFNGQLVSGASDQYALGIVIYELLTGRTPFHAGTLAEVMRGHLLDPPPPVRELRPDVPAAMEACLLRMLAKKPQDRFPTLADAVSEFGAVMPAEEKLVRSQIVNLAKTGALMQPRMSVPLSPMPTRGPQRASRGANASAKPLGAPQRTNLRMWGGVAAAVTATAVAALAWTGVVPMPWSRGVDAGAGSSLPTADAPTALANTAPSAPSAVPGASVPDTAMVVQAESAGPAPTNAPAPATPTPSRSVAVDNRAREAPTRGTAQPPSAVRTPAQPESAPAPAPTQSAAPAPAPANGVLRIRTYIPGSMLYVNGEVIRQLPEGAYEEITLKAGQYQLRLVKDGCEAWTRQVDIVAGETRPIGNAAPSCPP